VANRVVFIGESRIVDEGCPAELIDSPANPRTRAFLSKVL
jgi:polar amino acid transport system ATP-binding protein